MKTVKRITLVVLVCWFLLSGTAAADNETAGGMNTVMKTHMDTVRTNGFAMDYFRFGQGEKVLVILPGLSVESVMEYADAVAEAYSLLSDQFTVYVFDRRKELPETYPVCDMAEDTAASIRALGLDRVCLFGASQGGMIAMVIAVTHPELVSRLVLGSTSACMEQDQYQVIDKWVRLAEAGSAEDLYLAFGEAVYPADVFEQFRDLLLEEAKAVTERNLHRFITLAKGMKGFDMTDRLRQIACPVLVIGSVDDHVLGAEAAERIAQHLHGLPDFELVMYDGYGHAAYDTAPDYKEKILRFLMADQQDNLTQDS